MNFFNNEYLQFENNVNILDNEENEEDQLNMSDLICDFFKNDLEDRINEHSNL